MNDLVLWLVIMAVLAACWVWAMLQKPKGKPGPDEHETMVRPRDAKGRWVKEGSKGAGTPWNRKKGARK